MLLRLFFALTVVSLFVGNVSAQSNALQTRQRMGKVTSPVLGELSGIVPSVHYEGYFWVHNDSGDEANIYLIDSTARLVHTVKLEGIDAVDFEEIAWFYNQHGRYSLVVGDIGDNRAVRKDIAFHVLEEPKVDLSSSFSIVPTHKITTCRATYPDGARDAEAFFIDPVTNQLILISKRDFHVHVYTLDFSRIHEVDQHVFLKRMQLPIHFVTAADISRDGHAILIKNLTHIYLWRRASNEPIEEMFGKPYRNVTYDPEPQGEAIAFGTNPDSFYTISESPLFLDSYLYRYKF